MFPRWSLEGGRKTTLKRLQDADIREKIKQETSQYIHRFHGPEGCVLADFPPNSDLEGKNLEEISQNFHCSPEEAAMRLYEESEGSFVLHSMNDEDVYDIAKYEFISVASDGNSYLAISYTSSSFIECSTKEPSDSSYKRIAASSGEQ
jgi:hypothetical protein